MTGTTQAIPMPSPRSKTIHVGSFRRFGKFGPVYRIVAETTKRDAHGQPLFEIEVPESGEHAEYSAARILADPEVR